MKKGEMKTYSLEEITDKHIGSVELLIENHLRMNFVLTYLVKLLRKPEKNAI